MTTADDVKKVLKDYAMDNHPEWKVASAMFRVGELGDLIPCETLVIIAEDFIPHSSRTTETLPTRT